ncbi:beta strand repeat-containing protein [Aeromicrobium sp. CF3.5]|uniref:beta strand repeat-containing protein n=1 Tax=Aeromicrobium sp. CF3.5 TaxID=3373078 RepID=UPI003EE49B2F
MTPPRPSKRLLSLAAVSALGLTVLGAAPASAATFSVSNITELRAAVAEANATPGVDTIRLTNNISFARTTGDIEITDRLVINGRNLTINAAGVDRAFTVTDTRVAVRNTTIRGGAPAAGESGGALLNDGGTLTMNNVRAVNNVVTGTGASGGAVASVNGGTLNVVDSTLASNSATRAGGAIEANGGSTTVTNTTMSRNTTGAGPGNGGALHLTGAGTVAVTGSTVTKNEAAAEGGGLWNSGTGTMTVTDTRVVGNTVAGAEATQGGGGLFQEAGASGTLTVTGSTIADNTATGAAGSGGGILNDQGTVSVSDSTIARNTSVRAGGGIEANIGSTLLDDVRLNKNTTGAGPGNGGGLHLTGAGDVTVARSTVSGNKASAEGGGLWNSATGTFLVDSTRVTANIASGNDADQGGGGIFNDGGALTVRGSRVLDNVANGTSGSGGGIISLAGSLNVSDTVASGNVARRAGGGIEVANGTAALTDLVLRDNVTSRNPGNGGGLHVGGTGSVTYDGGTVTGNIAAAEGGGLWNGATATLIVTGVTIRSNTAPVGSNVYNQPAGGDFRIDGTPVPAGPNSL